MGDTIMNINMKVEGMAHCTIKGVTCCIAQGVTHYTL